MSEVTRTCRCPECSLPFFIKFESQQPLSGTLVRVGCPRCEGFIRRTFPLPSTSCGRHTDFASMPGIKGLG